MPPRVVERSQIVLLAAGGLQDIQIAAILRITPKKVARWRERFQRLGLSGLLKDAPRPGRAPTITRDIVQKVIDATMNENRADGARWTGRSMAAAIGISEASVRRIWHAHGITPRPLKQPSSQGVSQPAGRRVLQLLTASPVVCRKPPRWLTGPALSTAPFERMAGPSAVNLPVGFGTSTAEPCGI